MDAVSPVLTVSPALTEPFRAAIRKRAAHLPLALPAGLVGIPHLLARRLLRSPTPERAPQPQR
jgi:hypothetical protein